MSHKLVLITGGARSGKSTFAEDLAKRLGRRVLYVATAAALDGEMRERIAEHRRLRPADWRTIEATSDVGPAMAAGIADAEVVLIDCLAVLVSNLMMGESNEIEEERLDEPVLERAMRREIAGILDVARSSPASFILVSNEVGLGLVPAYRSGRLFRDLLGRANQIVAAEADEVYLVVAGIAIDIKRIASEGKRGMRVEG
ncbi:MAG: bifunctional adenosylcobinamide kinase/adenosylcobinamide-phosphate guanylyltransferase [Dehalococcoidia bacterium]|nr:bifunctional adenosylcobinamide kinase/adenosylcobinamide-phosphate guanylyltransferase [Dehalococcoidia bacterium]